MESQDIVGLVVDDAGIVQLVRVLEPVRLQTLVAKLQGQSLLDMLDRQTYDLLIDRSLSSCQTGQAAGLECLFNLRDRARWFSVTVRRMRNGAVPSKAFSVFVHNVERRTTIAERLKTSQTLLDHAERLAEIGTWEADLREGHFGCSEQLLRILHLDREQMGAAKKFLWRVVSRCAELPEPLNGRRQASPVEFELDYIPPDDDNHRLLLTRTFVNGHQSGSPLHFIGIVKDITERRHDETRVRESEALLAQAEELANTGSWEYDATKRTFLWSTQFRRMLARELNSEPVSQNEACRLLHEGDRLRIWRDAEQIMAGQAAVENEARFTLADGRTRILHSRAVGVKDFKGRIAKIRGVSQDVTERRSEEERLRKSEALLAQAEQLANLGSWDLDVRAGTSMWSEELFRLLGLGGLEESRTQEYWDNLHEEDRSRVRQVLANAIVDGKRCEYLARYRLPTGAWRIHQTRALPIRGADGETAHMIGVVQDITDQKRAEEKLHQLSQALMRLRDEERRHMARELHESAGQTLAALKMTLGNLRETLPKRNSRAHKLSRSCTELAEEVVREVRTVSYLMHPPMLDEAGLALAVRWYARGFSERSKIQVNAVGPEDFGRLPQEVEMTLFRIIQEALTNVHRHSGSRIANIRLMRKAGQVQVEIEDEGSGFTVADPPEGQSIGVGITGMRERVIQLGGTFEIDSLPGRGTLVRATLNDFAIRRRDPIEAPATSEGAGDIKFNAKRGRGMSPATSKGYRILIADDHSVVRRGLRMLLTQPGIEVCGEATTGPETVQLAKENKPNLVILDLAMPGMNGLETAKVLREECPDTDVMVLSMHFSEELAREALKTGVKAYVLKSDADTDLLAAVDHVRHKQPFFTGQLATSMLHTYMVDPGAQDAAGEGGITLTARELEVVQLLAEGKSNKQVAAALQVSIRTVESHRNHINHKMGFGNFSDMVRFAVRNNLVEA